MEDRRGFIRDEMKDMKYKEILLSWECIDDKFCHPICARMMQYFGGDLRYVKGLVFDCVKVSRTDCPLGIFIRGM